MAPGIQALPLLSSGPPRAEPLSMATPAQQAWVERCAPTILQPAIDVEHGLGLEAVCGHTPRSAGANRGPSSGL